MKTIIDWSWTEAFDKFGFNDGDGINYTDDVANFIEAEGYTVECEQWGCHNYMIQSVKLPNNVELLNPDKFQIGYDEPHKYLPLWLVKKLYSKFPNE